MIRIYFRYFALYTGSISNPFSILLLIFPRFYYIPPTFNHLVPSSKRFAYAHIFESILNNDVTFSSSFLSDKVFKTLFYQKEPCKILLFFINSCIVHVDWVLRLVKFIFLISVSRSAIISLFIFYI